MRTRVCGRERHGNAVGVRRTKYGRYAGSSLIEMLVWMAIVITISSVMYVILNRSSRLVRNGQDFLQSQGEMDIVLRRILRDARSARAVLADLGSARSETDTLILEVPAVDPSGNMIPERFDTVIYENFREHEEGIVRKVFPDTESSRTGGGRRLWAGASQVAFRYSAPDPENARIVTVTVASTFMLADRKRDISLSGSALLRNRQARERRSP